MEPRIENLPATQLVGMCIETSISYDDTAGLWKNFMSGKDKIEHTKDQEYYSIQEFPKGLKVQDFTEETRFIRWAAVAVHAYGEIPEGMEAKELKGGLYAVFTHVGPVRTFIETSNYIYDEWLPKSSYVLDQRAHFERLGAKYYGPDHPESEEELWIPIKPKNAKP